MDWEPVAQPHGTQRRMPRSFRTDQENKRRILDASIAMCRKHGIKTTVSSVARQLHMSPANIYRFYASKRGLYDAVLEHVLKKGLGQAFTNAQRPVSAAARLMDHVLGQLQFMLDVISRDRELFELMVLGEKQQWPAVQTHWAQLRLVVSDLIQQGIEAREFPQQDSALAVSAFARPR